MRVEGRDREKGRERGGRRRERREKKEKPEGKMHFNGVQRITNIEDIDWR